MFAGSLPPHTWVARSRSESTSQFHCVCAGVRQRTRTACSAHVHLMYTHQTLIAAILGILIYCELYIVTREE